MADPASSGANSHLQSMLAAQSAGEKKPGVLPWIMSFGNLGGANLLSTTQGMAGKLGLAVAFGWLANAGGLKNIVGGDKLNKKAMISMFSKNAKPLGPSNTHTFAQTPALNPPSLPTPQAPGGGHDIGHH